MSAFLFEEDSRFDEDERDVNGFSEIAEMDIAEIKEKR